MIIFWWEHLIKVEWWRIGKFLTRRDENNGNLPRSIQFNTYWLRAYYILDSVLGAWNTEMIKKNSKVVRTCFLPGGWGPYSLSNSPCFCELNHNFKWSNVRSSSLMIIVKHFYSLKYINFQESSISDSQRRKKFHWYSD